MLDRGNVHTARKKKENPLPQGKGSERGGGKRPGVKKKKGGNYFWGQKEPIIDMEKINSLKKKAGKNAPGFQRGLLSWRIFVSKEEY